MGLYFDQQLHQTVIWLEKRAFLVAVLTTAQTHCAFSQNIAPVLNIFCIQIFLLILSCFIYFNQGRRSCPRASCSIWLFILQHLQITLYSHSETCFADGPTLLSRYDICKGLTCKNDIASFINHRFWHFWSDFLNLWLGNKCNVFSERMKICLYWWAIEKYLTRCNNSICLYLDFRTDELLN